MYITMIRMSMFYVQFIGITELKIQYDGKIA